ncbi:MAG TPA: trimethylamine methyltransferase family protein [Bacillota bacterium]|nr:trimethylamine methyltransferase family protein [Bacillota bacterium]
MKSILSFLSMEEIERIHEASLAVLEKTGIIVHSENVCKLLAQNGASVDGNRVKIPRAMVEETMTKINHEVFLAARDPAHDLRLPGPGRPFNTTSGYSPFVRDLEYGLTRPSTSHDLKQFALVGDYLEAVAFFWPIVMPGDEPAALEELCALDISFKNLCKHVQCSCSSPETAEWQIRLAAALAGGEEKLRERPLFSAVTSPVSPLTFEKNTVEAMVTLAKAGIPVVPMTMAMAGTTAPATLAGTLLVANAEELATLVIVKCANPDAPMIYSADIAPSDLKTGVVNYYGPEYPLLATGCAQLARYYGIPSMVSHGSSEDIPYDQPSFERNILKVVMSFMTGTDLSSWLGSLESALNASLINLIMDAEICEQAFAYLRQFEVSDDTLALDIIDAVGPGGHYLSQKHTVTHFRKELWTKKLKDTLVLDRAGGSSFAEKAKHKVKEILSNHTVPPIDADIQKEMDDVMQKARRELG